MKKLTLMQIMSKSKLKHLDEMKMSASPQENYHNRQLPTPSQGLRTAWTIQQQIMESSQNLISVKSMFYYGLNINSLRP